MILDTLLGGRQALTPGPTDDYWYGPVTSPTRSGVDVTEDTALTLSAVSAATRAICETGAMLPLLLYERLANGGKERANEHAVYGIIHDAPNPEATPIAFWNTYLEHSLNWGNAFAEIERLGTGRPMALWPIHPSRIPAENVKRNAKGELVYWVKNDTPEPPTPLPAADVLHLTGVHSGDAFWGKGIITLARESIGLGLATERYGAGYFGNGARPGGVLEHPGRLSDVARKNLRESWQRTHGGSDNAGKTAILEEGMKFHVIDVPPEDAQFLQTRQFNITDIARWYRVPPHIIADLSRSTFSNIEHQGIEFVVYSIMPWLVRLAQTCNAKLLTPAERKRYFCEHLVDALLRGDAASRSQALQTQFLHGAINIDEWRAIENRNPLPDDLGKKHFVPLNMVPVDQAVKAMDEEADAETGDTPNAPDAPATDATGKPVPGGDVQASALNGAQITGLLAVTDRLAQDQLPPEGGRAILEASFPLVPQEKIDRIIDELKDFDPPKPEVPEAPAPGQPPDGPPQAKPAAPPGLAAYLFDPGQPRGADGKWSGGGAARGHGSDELHGRADSASKSWGKWARELPGRAMTAARDKVTAKFAQLEGRYGRKMAFAIMGAGLAGTAVPLPGTSFLAAAPLIAAAELYRRYKGPKQLAAEDDGLTDHEIEQLGREWITELLEDWRQNDLPVLEQEDAEQSQEPLSAEVQHAARAVLEDAVGRMVRREVGEAVRASKTPGQFLAKLDGFYPTHREAMASAILPAVRVYLTSHGLPASWGEPGANVLAEWHCDASWAALLDLSGECTATDLESRVVTLGETWKAERPAAAVEYLYSPSQPRDSHGKWTSGGGGVASAPPSAREGPRKKVLRLRRSE